MPTLDRAALVRDALPALRRVRYPSFEIVVVDWDDSTQRVVEEFRATDSRLRYYKSRTVGSSAGRKLALTVSASDIVAYTDDNCLVTEDWLSELVAELSRPEIAGVFGRMLPYGYTRRAGTESALKNATNRTVYEGMAPLWYVGHGGNMAFRREALASIGGFGLLRGAGCVLRSGEDADITYRLLASGRRVSYTPRALTYHMLWRESSAQKEMERSYAIGAGALLAKLLWCGDLSALRLLLVWTWELGARRLAAGLRAARQRRVALAQAQDRGVHGLLGPHPKRHRRRRRPGQAAPDARAPLLGGPMLGRSRRGDGLRVLDLGLVSPRVTIFLGTILGALAVLDRIE